MRKNLTASFVAIASIWLTGCSDGASSSKASEYSAPSSVNSQDLGLKPEMLVKVDDAAIACVKKESFLAVLDHIGKGEFTKAKGLGNDRGGDCGELRSKFTYRILSVDTDNPDTIIEVIGKNSDLSRGMFMLGKQAHPVE